MLERTKVELCFVALLVLVACSTGDLGPSGSPQATAERLASSGVGSRGKGEPAPSSPRPEGFVAVAGTPIPGANVVLGEPVVLQNLTVFPVLSQVQLDLGPISTLEEALKKNKAEVREIDSGGSVGTLVIENKGTIPIYVLAGTIVKGGKQDRQIGQDFVVDPKAQTPVDAFCVEQNRWDAQRDGQATGGKFTTSGKLAIGEVRSAAQYDKSQGQVWDKVAEVNEKHGKHASTGTLLVTLEDGKLEIEIAKITKTLIESLGEESPRQLVGFAYAIDGQLRGMRWFAHRKIWELFRVSLVSAAALDALTAQGGKPPKTPPPIAAADVLARMNQVEAAPEAEEETQGANVNAYKKSDRGYGSKVKMRSKDGSPNPAAPVSHDYVFK